MSQAMRWWFRTNFGSSGKSCDITLMNGGSFVTSLAAGNITTSDATKISPYTNNLVYFSISGPILVQVGRSDNVCKLLSATFSSLAYSNPCIDLAALAVTGATANQLERACACQWVRAVLAG